MTWTISLWALDSRTWHLCVGSEGVPGVFRAKEGPGQISEDGVPRGVQEARTEGAGQGRVQ